MKHGDNQVYKSLPFPEFLTPSLIQYLREVSDYAGREIVFADGRYYDHRFGPAKVITYPHQPVSVIVIFDKGFTQRCYNPASHDPVVAHEIGHVELHGEGWPLVDWGALAHNPFVKDKIEATSHWLEDALINVRIHKTFSLAPLKTHHIQTAISAIDSGKWMAGLQMASKQGDVALAKEQITIIRFYVHLILEPYIDVSLKRELGRVFRKHHIVEYSLANRFLDLIWQHEWDNPISYVTTLKACLAEWGLDPNWLMYEMAKSFTQQERQQFPKLQEPPESSWDLQY